MERHVRMQPRLYIEALKTLRVNQHLHKITDVGSKLRQHTGINQPSKWVETITDKLSNIQTTHEGELAPSSRFLVRLRTLLLLSGLSHANPYVEKDLRSG